jgi:hypothetical protein
MDDSLIGSLIGSHVIPDCLGGIWCADFLEGPLSLLLEDVPVNVGEACGFSMMVPLATPHAQCIIS